MSTAILLAGERLAATGVRATLVDRGYDVPGAVACADEAVALAVALEPALALIDVQLDGAADGIDAAREIVARVDVPVVLVGRLDEPTLQRALRLSPHGFVPDPVDERQLITAVEVAIHKHTLDRLVARRERWFSASVRGVGEAVVAVDGAGYVTFLNAAAAMLAGVGPDEARGQPLVALLPPSDERGEPLARPSRVAAAERFCVSAGEVVCFVDVTDRVALERRAAASERAAGVASLVAGMGHAMNSPLAAIIANGSMSGDDVAAAIAALDAGRVDEARERLVEVSDMLRDTLVAADRLKAAVADVRKMMRVDTTAALLDLPRVIETARRALAARLAQAAVSVTYGTTPYVEAREGELVQVFTQLLANAVDALSDGVGGIAIRAFTDDAGRAVVEIADTGAGIPVHLLTRVFEPFFTTRQPAGLGLGLTFSQRVVHDLGGEIGIEGGERRGSVARVAIPPARRPQPAPAPAKRKRLLVIDDEPSVARVIARVLGRDHDVVVETDPRAALARLASDAAFDLVFCDLHMPELSGRDVYEAVTAANARMRGRFVFVTGSADRDDPFLRDVPSPVILKPFGVEAIRGVVKDLLS